MTGSGENDGGDHGQHQIYEDGGALVAIGGYVVSHEVPGRGDGVADSAPVGDRENDRGHKAYGDQHSTQDIPDTTFAGHGGSLSHLVISEEIGG